MAAKFKVLTDDQVRNFHDKSLYILSKYGVVMKNNDALDIFKNHGAKVDGQTVKLSAEIVENCLKTIPPTFLLEGKNSDKSVLVGDRNPKLTPCGMPIYLIEDTFKRRAVNESDLFNFFKLAHSSDVCDINYAGIVYPQISGMDDAHILLTQTRTALSMSDKPLLGHAQDLLQAKASVEMASAATGKTKGCYFMGNVNSVSPMHWDSDMLEGLMYLAKTNQPNLIMGCAMAGLSAPITHESAFLMSNVEILVAFALSQMVNPGAPVVYGNHTSAPDMRTLSVSVGAPESTRLYAAVMQMADFYNIPGQSGGAFSDAKDFDVQMGIESMQNAVFNMANGTDVGFQFFGILDSYNSISYEKWISDEDVIKRVRKISAPLNDVTEQQADLIGQLGAEADYPGHPDTKRNYRKLMQPSEISARMNYGEWAQRGMTCRQLAKQCAEKRIAAYDYEDKKTASDLIKICEAFN